jgi:exosortase E/protease (VPEID-CTERM system)
MTRAAALAAILLLELLAVTNWLDGASLIGRPGLPGQIGSIGAWVLRFIVGFAAAFAAFAGSTGAWKSTQPATGRINWTWLAVHPLLAAGFVAASAALYGNWPSVTTPNLLVIGWLALGTLALVSACLAAFPAAFWKSLFNLPSALAATAVASLAVAAVVWSQSLWQSAARITFEMVQIILRPIMAVTVDYSRMRIKGDHFGVIISQECSGLEGAGLMLVFGAAWLWLYRRDFRFPRAYLLIPAGVLTLFLLNAFRIAALFLIGEAGASRIAAGGFHSQAGWIAFNGVAFGMTIIAPRLRWFSLHPPARADRESHDNPTAAYLVPFLAILAAGMLARAASADFEWLYVLRFVGAAVALWVFRAPLRTLDWRFGWWSVATGVAVFAMWVSLDNALPMAMPPALAGAGSSIQSAWISVRALAATTTVPITEELAFRAFGMRRLVNADFESVELRSATWLAILVSSVAFGLLHGDRWFAGTLAGLAFALVAKKTNRIGDAVAAHAIANLLLAVLVLYTNQWQYW